MHFFLERISSLSVIEKSEKGNTQVPKEISRNSSLWIDTRCRKTLVQTQLFSVFSPLPLQPPQRFCNPLQISMVKREKVV